MTPVGKSLGKICLLIVDVSLNHSCFTTFSIISLPIISTLQIPPKAMAQAPSEGPKVLIDNAVQALKVNDTEKPTSTFEHTQSAGCQHL